MDQLLATPAHWILYGSLAALAPWLLLWFAIRPLDDGMAGQELDTEPPEDADVVVQTEWVVGWLPTHQTEEDETDA